MQLTIQIPWLTRMRRMGIALTAMLILVAVAMPASAAPPDGLAGDVTVVNEAEDPVPVTGEVAADVSGTVTVDNDPTDPLSVTGSVAANVTGSVSITGQVAAEPPNASLYGSFAGAIPSRTGVTEAGVARLTSITVTALSDFPPSGTTDGLVQVTAFSPSVVGENTLLFSVRPGQPVTMSFPYPIAAESIEFFCIDFTDSCALNASWSGLAP